MVETSLPNLWAGTAGRRCKRLQAGDITIDPDTGVLYQVIAAEDQSNRVRALALNGDGYHPDLTRLRIVTRPGY